MNTSRKDWSIKLDDALNCLQNSYWNVPIQISIWKTLSSPSGTRIQGYVGYQEIEL